MMNIPNTKKESSEHTIQDRANNTKYKQDPEPGIKGDVLSPNNG
jgi:hypothetical protein